MTLVVSPLVALMEDQLTHLPKGLPGAALHSSQSPEHAAAVVNALRAGALKILFIAPERLLSRRFLELAASLPVDARFTFACVDECHCVSEWSHNFRPAYYHLGRVLRTELGLSRILALTATATRRTETAVVSSLGIESAHIIRAACMRANLRLTVSRESKRDAALLALLRPGGRLEHVKSVIAYASYKVRAPGVLYAYSGLSTGARRPSVIAWRSFCTPTTSELSATTPARARPSAQRCKCTFTRTWFGSWWPLSLSAWGLTRATSARL